MKRPILQGYADPDVLYHEGLYYLYATSYHISQGYEVYVSSDLIHWENRGNCMPACPWGLNRWFWAPDVKEHNGKFYMLASVDEHLGLCIADSPLGPFIPQTQFLFPQSIDGHILFEGEEMTIYYVSWRPGHRYGLWGCRMKNDHLTPDLDTETLLLVADQPYEMQMSPVAEAPYMLKKDGKYYLTYSGSHYQSPFYCIAYAVADAPLGPFVKYENNPILVADGIKISGIGHHCILQKPNGEMALIYHAHRSPSQVHPRDLWLGSIRFEENEGNVRLVCSKEG